MGASSGPAHTFLFDLDGTLLDSVALDRACYRHTFEAHGKDVPGDDVFLSGLGIPLATVMARQARDEAEAESMLTTYRTFSRENHERYVRAFPGVLDLLRDLRDDGRRVAVVTAKGSSAAWLGARITGMDRFVEVLVGADDVEIHKPDPFPYHHTLELLGEPIETAVVIGDSPRDLEAGRAGGFRTAAALWGPFTRALLEPHEPDHWLTEVDDIRRL